MLTIAIATNLKNIDGLLAKLKCYNKVINRKITFLVVWQGNKNSTRLEDESNGNLVVYNSNTKGLSAARNECIRLNDRDWIWFQDDDIELNLREVDNLVERLENTLADIVLLRIRSLENNKKPYKNYNFHGLNSVLVAFKVSSIELVVNSKFIKSNKVFFEEKLGLGTDMPCCEENVFLLDCLHRQAKVEFTNIYACYHTVNLTNRIPKNKNHFIARGYLLAKIPKLYAIFIGLRWCIREFFGIGFYRAFISLWVGYFNSKGANHN